MTNSIAEDAPQGPSAPTIRVVEVGPRDGLQNEPEQVPTTAKIAFIEALAAAGLRVVETTSFVSPKAVPQLSDADAVMRGLRRREGVRYPVLVPNERGLDRALAAGSEAIALFTSATQSFAQANVGTSIDGTFSRFAPVVVRALAAGLWIRGYVSVAFGCPYSGPVKPKQVIQVAARLFDLGCAEVSIADTIGIAQPADVERLLADVAQALPIERVALHFHDTNGQALHNVAAGLQYGVATFDAAAGGLGGCPFAPGAPGNVATESLVRFLASEGLATGVDASAVAAAVTTVRSTIDSRGSGHADA